MYIIQCEYIRDNNLAGGMFWEITLDDYLGTVCNDGTYPLINTLKDCLLSEYYMS